MMTFTKTIFAAAAAIALAGTASASTTGSQIAFHYDAAAPAKKTYKAFNKIAKKACRKEVKKIRASVGVKRKLQDSCRADLIGKAVMGSQDQFLIALHESKVGTQRTRRIFASRT